LQAGAPLPSPLPKGGKPMVSSGTRQSALQPSDGLHAYATETAYRREGSLQRPCEGAVPALISAPAVRVPLPFCC